MNCPRVKYKMPRCTECALTGACPPSREVLLTLPRNNTRENNVEYLFQQPAVLEKMYEAMGKRLDKDAGMWYDPAVKVPFIEGE